jgi:hypothetical protein
VRIANHSEGHPIQSGTVIGHHPLKRGLVQGQTAPPIWVCRQEVIRRTQTLLFPWRAAVDALQFAGKFSIAIGLTRFQPFALTAIVGNNRPALT